MFKFRSCALIALAVTMAAPSLSYSATRDLRVAFGVSGINSMEPARASAHIERAVASMVFNGLVRLPAGSANVADVEPDLAKSWTRTDDGRTWIFKLRKGVMFQGWEGGAPYELTAEDVVFSLKRAQDPKSSNYASDYKGMTFTAVDPYTVEIRTPDPISETLMLAKVMNYGGGFIISKRAFESLGAQKFRQHPVGTGPFAFKAYKPGREVDFVANANYFRGKPKLPGVEIKFMPDQSSRTIGLRTQELDVIEGSSEQSWVNQMKQYPHIKIETFGPGSSSVLFLNEDTPPLDKLKVRQALAYAISRKAVVAAIGQETAQPLYAPFPGKFLPGGLTNEEVDRLGLAYHYDVNKAKKLLAEAGYPNGITLKVIHTELSVMLRPMESIQAQLRDAGIKLDLQVVSHSTFHALIRKDASQIVHYMAWRPSADAFLNEFYKSDSDITKGRDPVANFSHYSNAEVDDLIAKAHREVDSAKQAEMWKKASVQILKDLPVIPIFQARSVIAHTDRLELGYTLNSNLAFFMPITEKTDLKD